MIQALKVLFERIKSLFMKKPSKPLLKSSEETHWVEPIYDATLPGHKAGAGGWVNVWGFREGGEGNWTYWVGYDYRWMGIRTQDLLVRCRSKSIYDKYIRWGTESWLVHNRIQEDPALWTRNGDDVETEFTFRWGDDDKSFNIRLSGDYYGIEK